MDNVECDPVDPTTPTMMIDGQLSNPAHRELALRVTGLQLTLLARR